jgi:hypothetical protein
MVRGELFAFGKWTHTKYRFDYSKKGKTRKHKFDIKVEIESV